MERDFMGLNSRKDSVVMVKEEAVEGLKDSGASSWMLSNKVSALPPFKPFKSAQDEKMTKVVPDHHAFGFMAISSSNAFDMKRLPGESVNLRYRTEDGNMLSILLSNHFIKTDFADAVQNFYGGPCSKQQFIGGVAVAAPCSVIPSGGFVAGTTEPWFSAKASNTTAQLTIFYGGSVNVFEDITPEKAQAIMFLAGSGCVPANMAQARHPLQSSAPKFAAGDSAFVNQTINAQPSSALSSPMSVSSHPVGHSGAVSPNSDEAKTPKTAGMLTGVVNTVEARMASLGPVATGIMPAAVPQARKASLARFLEKRKERAMNAAPYNLTKKSAGCGTPDSTGSGLPATSVAGCSSS